MKLSSVRVAALSFVLVSVTPTIALADTATTPSSKAVQSQDALKREEVQKNINYLTRQVAEKTRYILEEYGQFSPFGAALFPNGSVKYVWTKSNEDGQLVDPVKALEVVRSTLRSQTGVSDILGTAVVYPYARSIGDKEDDIQRQINMELEYVNGDAVIRAVQYTLNYGSVEFGASGEQKIDSFVFAPQ